MRFKAEGTFPVVIIEAMLAAPKFSQEDGAFDVCIKVQDAEGHEDYWRGEVSGAFGRGNMASKTQAQITLGRLEEIGWNGGTDFGRIGEMVGVETTATVKEKNSYYNIAWLGGGGNDPVALSPEEIAARLANVASFFPADAFADDEAALAEMQAKLAAMKAKKTAAPAKPAAPAIPSMPKAPAPAAGGEKPNPFFGRKAVNPLTGK